MIFLTFRAMVPLHCTATKWIIFLFCLYVLKRKIYIYFWSFSQKSRIVSIPLLHTCARLFSLSDLNLEFGVGGIYNGWLSFF